MRRYKILKILVKSQIIEFSIIRSKSIGLIPNYVKMVHSNAQSRCNGPRRIFIENYFKSIFTLFVTYSLNFDAASNFAWLYNIIRL